MLLLQRTILRMILFANVAKRLRYFLVPPPPFSDAVSGPVPGRPHLSGKVQGTGLTCLLVGTFKLCSSLVVQVQATGPYLAYWRGAKFVVAYQEAQGCTIGLYLP